MSEQDDDTVDKGTRLVQGLISALFLNDNEAIFHLSEEYKNDGEISFMAALVASSLFHGLLVKINPNNAQEEWQELMMNIAIEELEGFK